MPVVLSYDGTTYDNTVPRYVFVDRDAVTGVALLHPRYVIDRLTGQTLGARDQDRYLADTGRTLGPGERGHAPDWWWRTQNYRDRDPVVQPVTAPGQLWLRFVADDAARLAMGATARHGQAVFQTDTGALFIWDVTLGTSGDWRVLTRPGSTISTGNRVARPAAGTTDGDAYYARDERRLYVWSAATRAWYASHSATAVSTAANRPAAGEEIGDTFFAYDTRQLSVWTGGVTNRGWIDVGKSITVGPLAARPIAANAEHGDLYVITDPPQRLTVFDGAGWIQIQATVTSGPWADRPKIIGTGATAQRPMDGTLYVDTDSHVLWKYTQAGDTWTQMTT